MVTALAAGDLGIDYSYARPDVAKTVKAGAKFVFRYSAGAASRRSHPSYKLNAGKLITPAEFRALLASGEDPVANSEWYTTRVTEGAGAGKADAQADAELWHACGYAKGASIYCSWDAAPVRSKWTAVDEYLHAYEENLQGQFHVDAYAGTPFLQWALSRHRIRYGWRPNAGSWSGDGLPYQPGTGTRTERADLVAFAAHRTPAAIWQTGNYWFSKNADENMILRPTIGSHRQALAAAVIPPKPTPPPGPAPHPTVGPHYDPTKPHPGALVAPKGAVASFLLDDGRLDVRRNGVHVRYL